MTTRINQFNIANTATPELAELTVTGNVTANSFIGDGSQLTGIEAGNVDLSAVAQSIIPAANITYDLGNTTNRWRDIYLSGNTIDLGGTQISAEGGNLILPATVQIGNVTLEDSGGNLILPSSIQIGNVTLSDTDGNLSLPENITAVTVSASGNITGGNLTVTGVMEATGNIAGGNLTTAGLISATGNISGGNLSGTNIVGTLTTAAQTNITSLGTLSSLSVTGNVTAGNVSGTLLTGTLTTAAQTNVTSVGTLTSLAVTGNVSGDFFLGNGSLLTGISTSSTSNAISSGTSDVTVIGVNGNIRANVDGSTIHITSSQGFAVTGTVTVSGNITGGNLTPTNALAVIHGGTGATTAANALSNLGAASIGKAIAMTIVFG